MFITETQNLAVRKNCIALLRDMGVKSITQVTPHQMTWAEINAAESRIKAAAPTLIDKMHDASSEKADELESAADGLMRTLDALKLEKDIRNEVGSKEPRERAESPGMLARRPNPSAQCRGVDDGLSNDEHTRAFTGWLRAPQSRMAQAELDQFETRTASSLTGSAGGHVVPEIIAGPILSRARDANPLRGVVRLLTVASGDVKFPLSNADATSGWVGETDARTATSEPTLDAKIPTFGINYAYVKMTEELANDSVVDITEWFEREAGMALGEAEMAAIISGDGTKKPKGMLNVAPEAGADGTRTADAFKFLPAASATAFTTDEMLDLVYDLKARYRASGRWLMNSSTAGALRKLKTSDGVYLWQDSLINGQPNTFSGYPVTICEAMEDVGADNHPIAFGDFQAAYILAQIQGMTVTSADQSITEPGFNKVYIRQRIGGCVYDENAVRFLKMAAS